MKNIGIKLFFGLLLAFLGPLSLAFAQLDPPDPTGGAGTPISGGVGVLLAAGAAYGIHKFRKKD
jgi:LPXTG-motif cell wall-anchored protein